MYFSHLKPEGEFAVLLASQNIFYLKKYHITSYKTIWYNTASTVEKLLVCQGLTGKTVRCYNLFTKELRGSMLLWIIGGITKAGTVLKCDLHLPGSAAGPTYRGKHRVYTRLVSLGEVAHRSERRHAGRGKPLPMCYPAYSWVVSNSRDWVSMPNVLLLPYR